MPTPNGMFGGPWLVLWWSGVIVSFGAGCSGILIVQLCAAMAFGLPLFGNSPTVCFGMSFDSMTRKPSLSVIRTRFVAGGFLFAGTSSKVFASETLFPHAGRTCARN